jgi:hypothetical protein
VVLVGHQLSQVFAFGSLRQAFEAPVSDLACCSDFASRRVGLLPLFPATATAGNILDFRDVSLDLLEALFIHRRFELRQNAVEGPHL